VLFYSRGITIKKLNPTPFINKFHSVFRQLLFVWLAFFVMVIMSYLFVRNIVRDYLAKEAKNALSYTYSKIVTDLRAGETTLQNTSQSILDMILRGNSVDVVLEYMEEITNYLSSSDWLVFGFNGVYGVFDVFENAYLDGSGWIPPEDYVPQERPWYKAAIEANGKMAATRPYIDADTLEPIISYSRQIFDKTGNPLGTVCVDVLLDKIAEYVINTRLAEGGYGMLLSDNMEILATPAKEYIGRHLSELPYKGITNVASNLENDIDIYEHEVIDDMTGIKYVLFSKQLENGWHMGIFTPVEKYYQNVTIMRIFITGSGIVLALLLSFTLYRIAEAKRKADEKSIDLERAFLKTMAELVERRDDITGGHIDRTQRGVGILLDEVKRSDIYKEKTKNWDIDLIIRSSQLHDIGKISIEDRILKKPGKLDNVELSEMKNHTTFGEQIIAKIETMTKENEFLKYAKIFAVSHHEKWDGTGYPKGLKENEIPLLGRIMAIADVYDALISERPYKKAFTHEEAINIIAGGKEKQFDPFLVELFMIVSDKFKE
jgi:hypothetical protein